MMKLMIFLISVPMFSGVWQRQPSILETRCTMTVYAAEILESVLNRVAVDKGQTIIFNILQLLPYQAKAKEYKNVTAKEILDDQLAGTPFRYRMNRKKQLEIYKLTDNGTGQLRSIDR